jgi:hypothetical protein
MKTWGKDEIVEEVRKAREEVAREEDADPEKFRRETAALIKKLGMKKSTLKPLKLDLSLLHKKRKRAA